MALEQADDEVDVEQRSVPVIAETLLHGDWVFIQMRRQLQGTDEGMPVLRRRGHPRRCPRLGEPQDNQRLVVLELDRLQRSITPPLAIASMAGYIGSLLAYLHSPQINP
jgi:hypothetical protein